jgi:hypothetical protein
MKTKISIPTNDKIFVSENFESSEFFKVITIDCGMIKSEKFVKNNINKQGPLGGTVQIAKTIELIADCDYIVARNPSDALKNYIKERKKTLLATTENIITNAEITIINDIVRMASDTCCCP